MITTGVVVGAMGMTTACIKLAEAGIKLMFAWGKAKKEARRQQQVKK